MRRIGSFRGAKQWPLTFLAMACASALLMAVPDRHGRGPSTSQAAASPAEIAVEGPAGAQQIGLPFQVTTSITRFQTGGGVTTWAGWSMQLAYDGSVLQVNSVVRGSLCPASSYGNPQVSPTIITGCVFQSSTATGTMDVITFECIDAGSSPLHLVTLAEDPVQGTTLFDENAVNIATDLVDGAPVTCLGAATPTPTNTHTPTPTPVTPTLTPTPTSTPTPPAEGILCTTNVGGLPTLGVDADCDTDLRFGGVLGDGCADSEDSDPEDPWGQLYSVPVPALIASPGGLRDHVVTIHDVQAVFAYFDAGVVAGTVGYEQDANSNGVKDGWEYDRRILAGGALGPPDGTVTIQEAQAAFAQFKLSKRCSSGYNLVLPLCTTNVGGPPTLGTGFDCDFVESLDVSFEAVLGDGCVDSEDANPGDPWGQIFTVPAPALFVSPSSYRDHAVTLQDAQAILAYFKAGAATGAPVYEQDLNGNGVKDGWEYDRRIFPGGALGPPDGAVTSQEAQAAFAQYQAGVRCSSGYNMRNAP